ncbi:hypothetical protein [Streptosporangium sp. CA-115845]
MRVEDCRAAKLYIRFEVHGPVADRWMETVCRAINDLSGRGLVDTRPAA